ncbi:uncharacterized protein with TBP-like fold DUF4468 [Ancylomarina subtilis]|uniref:Uncharacterized protein with TBP-like fold DUF4468 n=1 Tax=Ancylomarina subtilis TaxID=1639035 RepID=A0A4V2FS92_9BACT|nr:DUF4468 domain-containing protein [Ancylomarina subtilis]RZT93419.1 uncharacterized protein with TBP-like fold DUF4468 [Ancylomarina subtilis]
MITILLNLLFVFSLFVNGYSQKYNLPIDSNGNIVFKEVINSNLSKSKLYSNAQEWIAKTFGDYKKVIQFEDEVNGKLILKGVNNVKHFVEVHIAGIHIINRETIKFTLTIECKENRYRYIMDNIVVSLHNDGETWDSSIFERINDIKSSKNKIERLNQELEDLKKIDTSSYKRKQLKRYHCDVSNIEKQIKYATSGIESNTKFIDSELEAINTILPSLKIAMSKKDDF